LLTNDGTGHFDHLEEITLPERPWASLGWGNMVAADLNADGFDDLVFGSAAGLFVLFNRAGAHKVLQLKGLDELVGLAAADLDGDGSIDLALSGNVVADSQRTGVMKTLINDGSGMFTEGEAHAVGTSNANPIAIADLDRDSFPDVVVADVSAAGVQVLRNHGDGTFAGPQLIPTDGARGVLLEDLNGDSWIDMAVINSYSMNGIAILANDRRGGFRLGERFRATDFDNPLTIVGGDFNEDGAPDLATTASSPSILVWLNQLP
jgi:hypothetical protein